MAIKSDAYNKFKAIQLNNEEIAKNDFAGMTRNELGWAPSGATAQSILGGQPLLKAGGAGAKILDLASTEPKPKTTGQAILKAAGQWKPLNAHYAAGGQQLPAKPPFSDGHNTGTVDLDVGIRPPTVQQQATTPTVPATPTTEGVPSVEQQNAKQNVTSPVNKTYTVNGSQMTLGEYIKSISADPNAAYRQSVEQANAAYDRQRATYGAEAEALAGQGLGKSGTSDYLDASAYAAKQKAISQAAATRDATKTALAGQYSTYLQQERAAKQEQILTALDRAAAMQLNSANTVKYLMAMTGMTKSEAEQYAEGNAALLGTTEADTTQATLQEITQEYARLVSTDTEKGGAGMSDAAARAYLKGAVYGYDAALVDQAANDLIGAYEQTKADNLAASQQAVSDVFEKVISIWDGATAQAKLAELGINVTLDEETGELGMRETRNAITSAYKEGKLTDEQYLTLHRQVANETLKEEFADGDLNDALQVAVDYSFDKQVQKAIEKKIQDNTRITSTEIVAQGVNADVELHITVNDKATVIECEAVAQGIPEAIKKQKGENHEIKVHNGKVYYYFAGEKAKGWYLLKEDGLSNNITEEQGAILYKLIAQKYEALSGARAGILAGVATVTKKKQ